MELVSKRSSEAIAKDARDLAHTVLAGFLPAYSSPESASYGAEVDTENRLTAVVRFSMWGQKSQHELRLNPEIWTELQDPAVNLALRALARSVDSESSEYAQQEMDSQAA